LWADARARWSALEVSAADFASHMAARMPDPLPAQRWLEFLQPQDLYLACGCARGDAEAMAALEAEYGGLLSAIARRYSSARDDAEDLAQMVRVKILVGTRDRPGRIADYSGRGYLENYLRVTAVRTCLDVVKRGAQRKREEPSGDRLAEAASVDDAELGFLKREYRAHFAQAFAAAARSLTSEQRNALRQHVVHHLTIDQIAALYKIHRSTAARRVARARAALIDATRRELAARLGGVSEEEVDSVMRLIESRLEVSVSRLFSTRGGDDRLPG
jgi:RNA polymerase sigma-70 factor (ECF subfamily)